MPLSTVIGLDAGVAASALAFGFRHGIDWDHIAALSDITAGQASSRRSMYLASLYALGHATVVFFLGLAAVLAASELPQSVDSVMEQVVGVTLVVFGTYVLVSLARNGRSFRMQSRWMLVLNLVRARRRSPEVVVVEHDHQHPVTEAHEHAAVLAAPAGPAAGGPARQTHSHLHRHVVPAPVDPFGYSRAAVFGVGMLHGIGGETPTQVLIFATAVGAGGRGAGVLVLLVFLVGLVAANTAVALAATFGYVNAARHWPVYVAVSCLTAAFSLVVGGAFIVGYGGTLPSILGG